MIEYNCRFGDPETQVVLPLLGSDLLTLMQAVHDETLAEQAVCLKDGAAACVIMASQGYPLSYEKGFPIEIPEALHPYVIVAGAKKEGGKLLTNGGRVLGVCAQEETLEKAVETAYQRTEQIHFANACYRHDIGKRALAAKEK